MLPAKVDKPTDRRPRVEAGEYLRLTRSITRQAVMIERQMIRNHIRAFISYGALYKTSTHIFYRVSKYLKVN